MAKVVQNSNEFNIIMRLKCHKSSQFITLGCIWGCVAKINYSAHGEPFESAYDRHATSEQVVTILLDVFLFSAALNFHTWRNFFCCCS